MIGGGGSGSGVKCCRSTPEPGIRSTLRLRHAEAEHESLVVGILHDGADVRSLEQGFERGDHERAGELALAMIADEQRAEPGQAVDHGDRGKPEARDAAEQHGLQRDVVQDVGLERAQQPAQLGNAGEAMRRREAAALPGQSMRGEALLFDGCLALVQPRRDMHLVAGSLGGARHGQAVGKEVPVLGDDVEDAWRGHRSVLPAAAHKTSFILIELPKALSSGNRRRPKPTPSRWAIPQLCNARLSCRRGG